MSDSDSPDDEIIVYDPKEEKQKELKNILKPSVQPIDEIEFKIRRKIKKKKKTLKNDEDD